MASAKVTVLSFDDVQVDLSTGRVLKAGQAVDLEPKAFKILVFFLENPGRLIDKRELLEAGWSDTAVTENALTRVVALLRKALGDDAREARYIETVHTLGYRFIAELGRPPAPAMTSRGRARNILLGTALVVIVSALIGVSRARMNWPALGHMEQLTTWTGLDMDPSFSPDGTAFAHSSDRTGAFEIHVRSLARGGKEVQLTSDGANNVEPAWSPDGELIAYHSMSRHGVWVLPAFGGSARQVSPFGAHPAWSPDGKWLAFQSEEVYDLALTAFSAMPPSTIWIVSRDGRESRRITQPGQPPGGHGAPTWSPDASSIAFSSLWEIWSVGVAGGSPERLSGKTWSFSPVFARDSASVYYVAAAASDLWLFRTAMGDGKPERLVPLRARGLSLSADGKKMLAGFRRMTSNLWSLPLNPDGSPSGEPTPVTQNTSPRNTLPAFSPDGRRVAFQVRRVGTDSEIRMVELDTGAETEITLDPSEDFAPTFRPNGREITYQSFRDGVKTLKSLDLETRRETRVLSMRGDWSRARLSPDGSLVAFDRESEAGVNVYTVSTTDGSIKQITFDSGFIGFPNWSPDGKFIVAEMRRGTDTHVCVVPRDGGEVTQLTFEPGQSWPYGWSPDGEKISFAGFRKGLWNLYWVSRRDKTIRQLTRYTSPSSYVRYPEWSPLGDRLVFEYAEMTGNVWMLELK